MLTTSRQIPSPLPTTSRSFRLPRIKAAAALLRHAQPSVNNLRYQNSLLPISQLPQHLLCRIFTLVASRTIGPTDTERVLTPRGHPSPTLDNCTWSWVFLTYVCHAWRSAALSDPKIWKYIDFSHPRWYNITISRAKMQPLDIRATIGRQNIQHLHRTLQLGHHISYIDIESSLHHIHILLSSLAHPSPCLKSMTVRVNTAGHGVQDSVYDEPSFPLTGPILPDMKYLELHSAPFYLISSRFTSLTNLHLHDLTPCEQPPLQQFLYTLSRYPNLQHLTLDNAFPLQPAPGGVSSVPFPGSSQPHPLFSSSPPTGILSDSLTSSPLSSPLVESRLKLPQLRTLTISGSIADITTILDSFFFPPSIHVACTITSLVDWQQSLSKLNQALTVHSYASSAAGHTPETIILSGITKQVYSSPLSPKGPMTGAKMQGARIRVFNRFTGGRTEGSNKQRRSPSPTVSSHQHLWFDLTIGPDITNHKASSEETIVRSVTSVWSALSLSRVHTLVLHDLDFITQKTWTQFLKDLGSLRVVDITGHAPSGFVWALLLNANTYVKREIRERERREKKALKAAQNMLGSSPQGYDSSSRFDSESPSPPAPPTLALSPVSPLSPIHPSSRKLFVPNLADIYINGVDCSSGGYMMDLEAPINSHSDLDDSRFLDVALACLQARYRAQSHDSIGSPTTRSGNPSPARSPGRSRDNTPTPTHGYTKLRSLSIANCSYTSKKTVLELREVVAHLVWDQQGMINDDNITVAANNAVSTTPGVPPGQAPVARYRKVGGNGTMPIRHYYRLNTLLDML